MLGRMASFCDSFVRLIPSSYNKRRRHEQNTQTLKQAIQDTGFITTLRYDRSGSNSSED